MGTGHDVRFAADALVDDVDRPWAASVSAEDPALPDFSPERRWTSVLLGALGIVVLAVLVAAVITVAHSSSEPAEDAPRPAPPSTSRVAVVPAPPSAVAPPPVAPARTTPPAFSSVTATASTVVAPPPPAMQPGAPQPNPGVRQRLHELFPRLFPNP